MLLAGRCAETVFFGPQGVSIQTKGDLVAAADVAYDIVTASGQYPDQAGAGSRRSTGRRSSSSTSRSPSATWRRACTTLMVRAHIRAEEIRQLLQARDPAGGLRAARARSLYGSRVRDLVDDHEVRMKMAKDAELAQARARAGGGRLRAGGAGAREEEAMREAEAKREAEAAQAARAIEDEGVGGAIDVEASEAPLSDDPFGTAAERAELARMEAEGTGARRG